VRDDISASNVQRNLGLSDEMMLWLERIEQPDALPAPQLPGDDEAIYLMERLGVEPADQADTLAARLDPDKHPELWWVFERIYHEMLANMGRGEPVEGFKGWPEFPASTGTLGMHLYVWLFLAVVPEVRRFHAARGIPDEISWGSLDRFGQGLSIHRAMNGVSGLGLWAQWGNPMCFRGADYQLGRLSFNRGELSFLGRARTHVLNVHVPPFGPVDADACDESLALAREFFPRHFPEEPVTFFVCHSWLMDDQLASYLPESSNIVRFQHRFRLVQTSELETSDNFILNYVFHRGNDEPEIPPALLDELPQDTTLQRAFVSHLRSGRHWYKRTAWSVF
jgi:GNAT-like C-terminal domain/N-acyltransferase N-terminal domain